MTRFNRKFKKLFAASVLSLCAAVFAQNGSSTTDSRGGKTVFPTFGEFLQMRVEQYNKSAALRSDSVYYPTSAEEYVNYGALFARNFFDMLSRCMSPEIRLQSLKTSDFSFVSFEGSGTAEAVGKMYDALKGERHGVWFEKNSWGALGNKKSGFEISYMTNFGTQAKDPFQALKHLDSLTVTLKKFSRIAAESNFKMSAAPSQLSADENGDYTWMVYTYKAAGTSTYGNFHKFINKLYNEKIPCAFQAVNMAQVKDDEFKVTAEVFFIVKKDKK